MTVLKDAHNQGDLYIKKCQSCVYLVCSAATADCHHPDNMIVRKFYDGLGDRHAPIFSVIMLRHMNEACGLDGKWFVQKNF